MKYTLRNTKITSTKWSLLGRKNTLALFHKAAERVPAYRDFLRRNNIAHGRIKSWSDFEKVPTVNKKNYLLPYTLEERCWDGNLQKALVFTSTSGSTGTPTFFPRGRDLDQQYSFVIERFIKDSSFGSMGPTLVLICFGMGVWIGGLITYQAFEIAAHRAHLPVSILTPGINKREIINALKLLAPSFRQVIIVGYAPFIRDLLEKAKIEGIDLTSLRLRFLFAAEAISEEYRNYLKSEAPLLDIYRDTLNIYGSADIGAMAYEGPAGIILKRVIVNSTTAKDALIGQILKTPTIAQFDPTDILFEAVNGEIILSGDSAVPLLRYAIGDRGGVFTFEEAVNILRLKNIHLLNKINKRKLGSVIEQKPFVYVYERADFSTTIYGLNVYPEYIREALLNKTIRPQLTGKFTMVTRNDDKQSQYLLVNVEMQKDSKPLKNLRIKTELLIVNYLKRKSSEFKELSSFIKNRKFLKVKLWPAEYPKYFRPGVKQTWVKRDR